MKSAEFANLLDMFTDAVRRAPDQDAIRYFDGALSVADLDAASDALAAALQGLGLAAGDRLALFSQNNRAFVIGMLATWKAGGIAVSANPMYKERELGHVPRDSGSRALICRDGLHGVARTVLADGDTEVDMVVCFSGRDFQTRDDERVFGLGNGARTTIEGTHDPRHTARGTHRASTDRRSSRRSP
ncbi:AMP-binding protein [Nocardia sp. NPDC049190]|uniref:AMP-binding protein n=1 Tax=Nocardia sp. NPDC049190 TaxID=3155650 RepID=UPI0033CB6E34